MTTYCPTCGHRITKPRASAPSAAWLEADRRTASRPVTAEEVPHLEAFGRLVQHHRKTAGLTRKELAERAGFSSSYMGMLERGTRRPRQTTIHRIARELWPSVGRWNGYRYVGGADPDYARACNEDPDGLRTRIMKELVEVVGPALAAPRKTPPRRRPRR